MTAHAWHPELLSACRSLSNLPKDVQGSGILGTTAGEEVGLSGLPDRSSVVQLLEFGQSSCSVLARAFAAAFAAAAAAFVAAASAAAATAAASSSFLSPGDLFLIHKNHRICLSEPDFRSPSFHCSDLQCKAVRLWSPESTLHCDVMGRGQDLLQ